MSDIGHEDAWGHFVLASADADAAVAAVTRSPATYSHSRAHSRVDEEWAPRV